MDLSSTLRKPKIMELTIQSPGTIYLEEEITKTASFRYLNSHISASGGLKEELSARINGAAGNWRSLTRVPCDKKMPFCL